MINSKALRQAVGTSQQDDIASNVSPDAPSINQSSVIVGRFKRGRLDRPFKVQESNYKALLGEDLFNPNYTAIEDAFLAGAKEIWVLRIGSPVFDITDEPSTPQTNETYKNIAFESNLYPILIYKQDGYQPKITALPAHRRSATIVMPPIIGQYQPSIKPLNIGKNSFGKSFDFTDAYQSEVSVLHAKLGSVIKQPLAIVDSYKPQTKPLQLNLRLAVKPISVVDDSYSPKAAHLNMTWVSKIKSKTIDDVYAPGINPLDLLMPAVLQNKPVNIGTDAYKPQTTLLDLIMNNGLNESLIDDGYVAQIKTLAGTLSQALTPIKAEINHGYQSAVKSLSMQLIDKSQPINIDDHDVYQASVLPLPTKSKSYLAANLAINDGYQPSLDLTVKISRNNYTVQSQMAGDSSYKTNIQALNILTTQRIRQ